MLIFNINFLDDGCSSTCEIESGFNCQGFPSVCLTICGDNIVAGNEKCDNGDLIDSLI